MACAAWALGEAGVDLVDARGSWAGIAAAGEDLVLHDSLCPMTPPSFIAECLEQARVTGHAVVGTRPVTDTVKVVDDTGVGETLDRDALVAIVSPLVLPAALVASLSRRPATDLARAVADLVASGREVEQVLAPSEARRVSSLDDVRLLEALTTARG